VRKSPFRVYKTIVFTDVTEIRSLPILVWLIEQWFMWTHEWLWFINKPLHHKLMYPFCVAYDIYIAPWVNGYERIDSTLENING
jgi:hypothetical protein